MVLIEDVIVPSKGIGKYFTITCLQIPISKTSEATPTFYWEVKKQITVSEPNQDPRLAAGETILNGNLIMTTEEYAQWTTDDGFVIDWALEQLGFKEITII